MHKANYGITSKINKEGAVVDSVAGVLCPGCCNNSSKGLSTITLLAFYHNVFTNVVSHG